jgi:hypothetical protein
MSPTDVEPRSDDAREGFMERRVSYSLEMDGRFYVVENVPARINVEAGEELFSPETIERLRRMIRDGETPVRFVETHVYQFAG